MQQTLMHNGLKLLVCRSEKNVTTLLVIPDVPEEAEPFRFSDFFRKDRKSTLSPLEVDRQLKKIESVKSNAEEKRLKAEEKLKQLMEAKINKFTHPSFVNDYKEFTPIANIPKIKLGYIMSKCSLEYNFDKTELRVKL